MKVAFLDRDGTLIYEPSDGLVRPQEFHILPGVIDALKALKDHDYMLVMVTNQSFGKGPEQEPFFHETQRILIETLAADGLRFDAIFLCPHMPEDHCPCRKPKTGMIDQFLTKYQIDLDHSFVIGDREENDGGLARNIGVRYVQMEPNSRFPSVESLLG